MDFNRVLFRNTQTALLQPKTSHALLEAHFISKDVYKTIGSFIINLVKLFCLIHNILNKSLVRQNYCILLPRWLCLPYLCSCFPLERCFLVSNFQNYADVSCRCEKSDQKQKIESFTGKRSGNVYELPEI